MKKKNKGVIKIYGKNESWRKLQALLPEKNRITNKLAPSERFISIDDMEIHLDEYDHNSNTTIVILHGVGGNGRLLSFFAVPLAREGYNVLCPDLPGYGYSRYQEPVTYDTWIRVGSVIVENELSKGRKVFLFGLSAGGMLAYNIACQHQDVSGLIVTNILDSREGEVRKYSAKNKFQAKYGIHLLGLLPKPFRNVRIPIRMVTNMKGLVNDKRILQVLLSDKHGAGSSVNLNFLLSMMNSSPLIEPEKFDKIPVLMVHPENDLWTPVKISELFFNRIAASKSKVLLNNAVHFPVEEPGLTQMENEVKDFIQKSVK